MSSPIDLIINKLNVPGFYDASCYTLHLNGTNVFLETWKENTHDGNEWIKEIGEELLQEIVLDIKKMEGKVIEEDTNETFFYKIVGECVIHIMFPPVADKTNVAIYKTGPSCVPWPSFAEIWSKRCAFVATNDMIHYGDGFPIKSMPLNLSKDSMFDLYRVFKRNAVGWFDGEAIYNNKINDVEILKLINGDTVVINHDNGPKCIQYFPAG